jgi:lysozyme
MSYIDILEADLTVDEGKRNRMYVDSQGVPSIGIGHNLRDCSISERAIRVIFEDDVAIAESTAKTLFQTFDGLSDNRKAVVVNMAFNLGQERLAEFHHFRAHVAAQDFKAASDEMLDSLWAKQVGKRAERLAQMMREG